MGCYYRPPSDTLADVENFIVKLDSSVNQATSYDSSVVILIGDFNSKHKFWHPEGVNNTAGIHLFDLLNKSDFVQWLSFGQVYLASKQVISP